MQPHWRTGRKFLISTLTAPFLVTQGEAENNVDPSLISQFTKANKNFDFGGAYFLREILREQSR